MSRLEQSRARLENALSRLEAAVAEKTIDLGELRGEKARTEDLAEAHDALKEDHEALARLTGEVSSRLDGALLRLSKVLAEEKA